MTIVFNKAYTKLPIILHAIIGSFFWEGGYKIYRQI